MCNFLKGLELLTQLTGQVILIKLLQCGSLLRLYAHLPVVYREEGSWSLAPAWIFRHTVLPTMMPGHIAWRISNFMVSNYLKLEQRINKINIDTIYNKSNESQANTIQSDLLPWYRDYLSVKWIPSKHNNIRLIALI